MFDRDEQEISRIIDESLDAIQRGEASLEEVLAQHPEKAASLRLELEAALWLYKKQEQVSLRPGYLAASRNRLVAQVKQEASKPGVRRTLLGLVKPNQRFAFRWAAALMVLFIMFSGAGGVVTFAQNALPGNDLYSVKRVSEQVALSLTTDDLQKVELRSQLSERRLNEVEAMIDLGDEQSVEPLIDEFQNEVDAALHELRQLEDNPSRASILVAEQVQEDLARHAERLDEMEQTAPTTVKVTLQEAQRASEVAAAQASVVVEKIKKKEKEATEAASPTSLPTKTATRRPTNTAVPPMDTAVPTRVPPTSTSIPQPVVPEPTQVPPTATQVPPTATSVPTSTPPEPTVEPTSVLPTAIPTESTPVIDESATPDVAPTEGTTPPGLENKPDPKPTKTDKPKGEGSIEPDPAASTTPQPSTITAAEPEPTPVPTEQ